jgi:sugar phosphate isomerase/epimerase
MLSCSTCWNSARHTSGEEMLQEILDLGFERVELGHGVRLSLMEGVQKFYDQHKITITSLHNFCPLPVEVMGASPDCYQFSSHRAHERERALKLTLQTIDFAERLGAQFVILHLGHVPMNPVTKQLLNLINEGKQFSREYVRLKIRSVKKREARSPFYLARIKELLQQIAEYAGSKNVQLGIEGRHGYEEIPSEREVPQLIEEINSPHVGYWHDFGHLQIKENLGFLDHHEWLSAIRNRLLGCHLHDVVWPGRDHSPPFTGGVDYDRLVPLLPENCLLVWEMSPRRTREEIVESLARWREKFGE